MTFFTILSSVLFLATLALLWCLRGFTRELRQGRNPVGQLERLEDRLAYKRINRATAVHPLPRPLTPLAPPARGRGSRAAMVVGLAILLGSR